MVLSGTYIGVCDYDPNIGPEGRPRFSLLQCICTNLGLSSSSSSLGFQYLQKSLWCLALVKFGNPSKFTLFRLPVEERWLWRLCVDVLWSDMVIFWLVVESTSHNITSLTVLPTPTSHVKELGHGRSAWDMLPDWTESFQPWPSTNR